jgi:hypothetical protein
MLNAQINSKWKFTKIGLLLFFVGLDIFYNCTVSKPIPSRAFTYYKKPIEGEIPFRIDGYYYSESCYITDGVNRICFFYPDGFYIGGNQTAPNENAKAMDAYINSIYHYGKNNKNTVENRGAFIVEKDSLKIQFFTCIDCNLVERKGVVLNDTTLLLGERIDESKGKDYYRTHPYPNCETFHFRKLNWKPDSTYQIGFEKQLKKGKQ